MQVITITNVTELAISTLEAAFFLVPEAAWGALSVRVGLSHIEHICHCVGITLAGHRCCSLSITRRVFFELAVVGCGAPLTLNAGPGKLAVWGLQEELLHVRCCNHCQL